MLATHAVIIFSVRIFTNRVIIDSNPEPSLSIVIQATMAQSPPSKHNLILLILLSGILTACQVSSRTGRQESEPTPEMATPPALQEEFLLLAPLYYLQAGQIWRLDSDAQTTQQVTHESAPIDAFDLSPIDGSLAYISNNSLILNTADGGDRRVLRAGPALTPIADEAARLNNAEHITAALRSPHWSPDGRRIAFIENGVQLYNLETLQAEQVWSQSAASSEPELFERVLSWSPDGQFLLVSQYAYPIESLGQRSLSLLQLGGPLYRDLSQTTGLTHTWSPELAYLFLANAQNGSDSSLMRCNPETAQCTLIAEYEPARWYYFYAHPFVTADDRLLVFMGASDDPSQPPEAFNLISLGLDGYDRSALHSDSYPIDAALWAPDGSGVIISLAQAAGDYPAGSVLWLGTDNQPALPIPLLEVSNLRWGTAHQD